MSFTDVDLARLLIALAVLLVAAHGVGALFARFGQPAAIGEIVGGILLGPSALMVISPTVQHWIFPSSGSSAAALGAVYELGLLLLMFAAGAEMRRLLQRDAVRTIGLIASFGLVLPFAAGLGLVAVLGTRHYVGSAGNAAALTLVFGMAVAVMSIPVISRIMHDVGLLGTRFARIVLSVAVIEDIVVYVVLAVAVGLVQTTGTTAFGLPSALHIPPWRSDSFRSTAQVDAGCLSHAREDEEAEEEQGVEVMDQVKLDPDEGEVDGDEESERDVRQGIAVRHDKSVVGDGDGDPSHESGTT